MDKYDIIVGKKVKGKPNLKENYGKSHRIEDLTKLEEIILKNCEEKYKLATEKVLRGDKFYPCNMLLAKSKIFNDYCEWLFGVLFKLEREIEISKDPYQARVFGFLSERMLGIYIEANKLKVKELNVTILEEKLELKLCKKIKYNFKLFFRKGRKL